VIKAGWLDTHRSTLLVWSFQDRIPVTKKDSRLPASPSPTSMTFVEDKAQPRRRQSGAVLRQDAACPCLTKGADTHDKGRQPAGLSAGYDDRTGNGRTFRRMRWDRWRQDMTTQISKHGKAPKGTHQLLSPFFHFLLLPPSVRIFSPSPSRIFPHPLHVKVVCHAWYAISLSL
jgi:hypothetical protein